MEDKAENVRRAQQFAHILLLLSLGFKCVNNFKIYTEIRLF